MQRKGREVPTGAKVMEHLPVQKAPKYENWAVKIVAVLRKLPEDVGGEISGYITPALQSWIVLALENIIHHKLIVQCVGIDQKA